MTTTQLAREIADDPRFYGDTGVFFNEIAARHGRDVAGVAWIQASLKIDALDRRNSGYAAKYVNDSDQEPTDANLKRVLARCVRAPRPEDYPAIRHHVAAFRVTRGEADGRPRVYRQDALDVVNSHPGMGAAFDAQWDGGQDCKTVGDQFRALTS